MSARASARSFVALAFKSWFGTVAAPPEFKIRGQASHLVLPFHPCLEIVHILTGDQRDDGVRRRGDLVDRRNYRQVVVGSFDRASFDGCFEQISAKFHAVVA